MTKRLALLLMLLPVATSAQDLQRNRAAEDEIWRLTGRLYEARLRNNVPVVNGFFVADYFVVESGGQQAEWGNRGAGPFNEGLNGARWMDVDLGDERVRVYGNTAVSTYVREVRLRLIDRSSQEQRQAASDTWVRQGGQWRLAFSQVTPVVTR